MSGKIVDRITRRKRRVSSNFNGTKERPRVAIHRSNKYIYAQAIDDVNKVTLVSFSSLQLKKNKDKQNKTSKAKQVGIELGSLLKEKKVKTCIFDRSRFLYHGRVQAVAEGLREAGIQV